MWFVYLLQSTIDGKHYIGYTKNLKQRFSDHNNGKIKSLRYKLPMKMIYFEAYANKQLAAKKRMGIKT